MSCSGARYAVAFGKLAVILFLLLGAAVLPLSYLAAVVNVVQGVLEPHLWL